MKLPAELACTASLVDDHPASMRQLRRLIVALAITGRLTEKRSGADASDELLRQFDARHHQLVTEGKLTRTPALHAFAEADLPDVCPAGPLYLRLGDVAQIEKGRTGIASALPGPYPLVVTARDRASCDHFDFEAKAAIVPLVSSAGHGKASLQRLHYQEGKFALGTILAAVIPHAPELLSARFIFEYLTSFKEELLVSQMIGTANVTLTAGKVANTPIPLVAPRVQRRVDELMALCDRLEAARGEREAARDRLTATNLSRLNAPDRETFAENVCFALDALPALTARADQFKQLRQTILDLAVSGKLVRQDAQELPAADWLRRTLGCDANPAAGEIEAQFGQLSVSADGSRALPATWVWVDLGRLVISMDAGWSPQCENHPRSDITEWGVLRTTAVQSLSFNCAEHKELPAKFQPRPRFEAKVGDILVTRAGPKNRVGISCVVDKVEPRLMISDKLIRVRMLEGLSPRFIALTLNAGISSVAIENAKSGMAIMQMNISQEKLRAVPIPLPPLAEQFRIVAKVDELMALCNQLETSLSVGAEHRARLLAALLHQALEPANTLEKAA